MAQPTATRRALRDRIATRLGMRFFRDYGGSSQMDSASSDFSSFVDNQLTQPDDWWNSAWLYVPDGGSPAPGGDVRRVVDFNEYEDRAYLDRPLSGAPAANREYQLFDIFSPHEIHSAINSANREGAKAFPGSTVQENDICIVERTLEYDLTGPAPAPWRTYNVWVEIPRTVIRGVPTAATSTTLSDTLNSPFANVRAGISKVSIYAGTGAGQVRTVSAKTNSQLTVSSWTTTPDTTSKYAVWDPTDQQIDWRQLIALRFNQPEFPTKMYLQARYEAYVGMRLRFQYSYKASDMDLDAEYTPVPAEFIEPWALKLLFQSRMTSNRMDRPNTASQIESYRIEAEQIRQSSSPNEPAMTIFQYDDPNHGGHGASNYDGDPMGWYN